MNLKQSFRLVSAMMAVALALSLGGCNSSEPTLEVPTPETSKPQKPTTPSPWQKLQLRRTIEAHTTPIRSLAISPDRLTRSQWQFWWRT